MAPRITPLRKSVPASGIGERIRQVRADLSRDVFAERLSIHRNTVIRYENEAAYPDANVLARICQEFGASPSWLLTGQGLINRDQGFVIYPELTPPAPDAGLRLRAYQVPSVNFNDSEPPEHGGVIAFRRDWLDSLGVASELVGLYRVVDDSMEPTFGRNDRLVFRDLNTGPIGDGFYIVRHPHKTLYLVRRVQCMPNGTYKLICDNPAYEAVILSDAHQSLFTGVVIALLREYRGPISNTPAGKAEAHTRR